LRLIFTHWLVFRHAVRSCSSGRDLKQLFSPLDFADKETTHMATEQEAVPAVLDLMTGRWRSQVLHAGVALGIYDALSVSQSLPAKTIAAEIGADEALLYRLMRASRPVRRGGGRSVPPQLHGPITEH
jgi:hypothetical protein